MRLGIKDICIQAHHIGLAKDEVEVFKRLGSPKALTRVNVLRLFVAHIGYGCMRNVRSGRSLNSLEHGPRCIL